MIELVVRLMRIAERLWKIGEVVYLELLKDELEQLVVHLQAEVPVLVVHVLTGRWDLQEGFGSIERVVVGSQDQTSCVE